MDRLRDINDSLIDCTISKNTTSVLLLDQYRKLHTAIYNHRKIARPIPNWLHKKRENDQEDESADRMQQFLNSHQ